jgi:two-component system, NtrC family, sensor histidine kinase HydH
MKLTLGVAPRGDGLPTRLAWVTALRLGFLLVLLGALAFSFLRGGLGQYPQTLRIVFGTLGAAFALGAVYAAALRTGRNLPTLAYAQIACDQLTWTAIVYVSGGITSGATSFYALTCLLGAILVGERGAAAAAAIGSALYVVLCAAFSLHWLAPPADQAAASYVVEPREIVYPLAVNLLGITVVGLLAGYLAERLRITGGELEAAQKRALEAERLAVLGRLATGLAHEIRNPLGSISGSIEMLRESPELSPEDKQLCDIVRREAARLNNLVTDMMDYAKPRAPKAEAVDVAALAREVVALATRSERSGAGDVSVQYDGPQGTTLARCDGAQMRQVLWNLVRNAVQASGAGSTVHVRLAPHGAALALSVEDQGPGISEAARTRLFDAFYTTRAHGVGIGLAVVKRIVDDHAPLGASIAVDSPEGGGARFTVALSTDVDRLPRTTSVLPPPQGGSEAGRREPDQR